MRNYRPVRGLRSLGIARRNSSEEQALEPTPMLVASLEDDVRPRPVGSLGPLGKDRPRRARVEPDVHRVGRFAVRLAVVPERRWEELLNRARKPVRGAFDGKNWEDVLERLRREDRCVRGDVVKRRDRDTPYTLAGDAPFRSRLDE